MTAHPEVDTLAKKLFEAYSRNSGNPPECHYNPSAAAQWMAQALVECGLVESALTKAEAVEPAVTGCVHHDFSILDSYIRNLRWSHDTTNEVRDAVASNLRGLYTHLLTRGLFAGSGSWDAGRLAAAKWIEKRRCAFADEYGFVDPTTGVLEFGNGYPERDEYYCELSEIEEAIRALPAPQFVAHAPPADLKNTRLYRAANMMMLVVGVDGEIPSDAPQCTEMMAALAEIDGGRHQPAVPPASVPDGYQLSASEARVLIGQHEWWIAEADSMGAEYSGNERKLKLLRAIATNQEGAAP